jgi:hypothetical protein
MAGAHGHTPAAWNLYGIERADGRWAVTLRSRVYDPATGIFAWGPEMPLSP